MKTATQSREAATAWTSKTVSVSFDWHSCSFYEFVFYLAPSPPQQKKRKEEEGAGEGEEEEEGEDCLQHAGALHLCVSHGVKTSASATHCLLVENQESLS